LLTPLDGGACDTASVYVCVWGGHKQRQRVRKFACSSSSVVVVVMLCNSSGSPSVRDACF